MEQVARAEQAAPAERVAPAGRAAPAEPAGGAIGGFVFSGPGYNPPYIDALITNRDGIVGKSLRQHEDMLPALPLGDDEHRLKDDEKDSTK